MIPNQQKVHNNKSYETYVLRRVNRSLKSIPIRYKRAFAADFQHIIDNNGRKYTLDRFKAVKQIILTSVSDYYTTGNFPVITQESKKGSSYIRMRSNHKFMAGYLGELQKLAAQSPKCLEQVIQLIHAYGLIIDDETTPQDIEQLSDIIEPRIWPNSPEHNYIREFCTNINGAKLQKFTHKILKNFEKATKRFVSKENGIEQETVTINKDMSYLLRKPIGLPQHYMLAPKYYAHENNKYFTEFIHFKSSQLYKEICDLIPGMDDIFPQVNLPNEYTIPYYPVGNMFLINEPGLKKRWVQNTKHIIQHTFRPFGQRLYDIVKYVPWDCTFDENKGYSLIQSALKAGMMCYSVDLSKATDKLPMEYNVAVLEKLLSRVPDAKGYIQAFYKLSRSQVLLPDITDRYPEYTRLYTRWNIGQPMGSYPSFAMLTLVHGLILFILNDYKWEGKWILHGDDIVILSDILAAKYMKFLELSGMEYSGAKTIKGTYFAEMNSKLITANEILNPVKWKPISVDNLLDVAPYWSVDMISKVCANKKVSHKAIEAILALPYPFGAGLNPKGLTLDERFNAFPGLLEDYFDISPSKEYIGSLRDLVSFRYSNYACIKQSPYGPSKNIKKESKRIRYQVNTLGSVTGEMDIECLQAYLRDMQVADEVDRQHCFNAYLQGLPCMPELTQDYAFIQRSWLSGNCPYEITKPQEVLTRSKNSERKKELKTRFTKALGFYQAIGNDEPNSHTHTSRKS